MKNRILKRILLLILTWLSLFAILAGREDYLQFQRVQDPTLRTQLYCLHQDPVGFLWVGTANGLVRFDGLRGVLFKPAFNGAPNSGNPLGRQVLSMLGDGRGKIWFGTEQSVEYYDTHSNTFKYYRDPNRQTGQFRLLALSGIQPGLIWGCGEDSLYLIDAIAGTFTEIPKVREMAEKQLFHIIAMDSDSDQKLWLASDSAVFTYHHGNKSWIPEPLFSSVSMPRDFHIRCMFLSRHTPGIAWFGVYGGLIRYDAGKRKGSFIPLPEINDELPPGAGGGTGDLDSVIAMCDGIFKEEKLVLATQYGRIGELDPKNSRLRLFTPIFSDIMDPVSQVKLFISRLSLLETREGLLWLAAGNRLYKADPYGVLVSEYSLGEGIGRKGEEETPGMVSGAVSSRTSPGNLWLSLSGKLARINLETGDLADPLRDSEVKRRLENFHITCLHEAASRPGVLWMGGADQGLAALEIQRGVVTFYNSLAEEGPYSFTAPVTSLYEAPTRPGTIWISTADEGLARLEATKGVISRESSSFLRRGRSGQVLRMLESEAIPGVLWLGNYQGELLRLEMANGSVEIYRPEVSPEKTPGASAISYIVEVPGEAGGLWMTVGDRLVKFDAKTRSFVSFAGQEQVSGYHIQFIQPDALGNLWLISREYFIRLTPGAGHLRKYANGREFLFLRRPEAGYRCGEAGLLMPGVDCFYTVRFDRVSEYAPAAVFTDFRLLHAGVPDDKKMLGKFTHFYSVHYAEQLVLDWRNNGFTIYFSAPGSRDPENQRYFYKLDDPKRWISLESGNSLTLMGMYDGLHELQVRAAATDGTPGEKTATIRFLIRPPFWKMWWFRLALLLGVGTVLFYWHRRRIEKVTLQLRKESEMRRIYDSYGLSPREQEVLELILRGKSNKEIEEELYISLKTVKTHIYNIYRKMGVSTRLELINRVQRAPGDPI